MFIVSKKKLNSLVPADSMGCRKRKRQEAQPTDEKSSDCDGSSSSRPEKRMVPYQVYGGRIDASRVPRIYHRLARTHDDEEEDGFYHFPTTDEELLDMSPTPSFWWGFSKSSQPEIYHVEMDADSCRVPDCVKLLKKIGCEDRLISCSVEKRYLFFAHLNKDEAAKLEGLDGIHDVYPRSGLLFPA